MIYGYLPISAAADAAFHDFEEKSPFPSSSNKVAKVERAPRFSRAACRHYHTLQTA